MNDIVDPRKRSEMMRNIRSANTKPEMTVRRFLHARGFRYRLHDKKLPGSPDIVLPKYRAVVFVHGCFWHHHAGCRYAYLPKSRQDFWKAKFAANRARDKKLVDELQELGWRVLVFWECALREQYFEHGLEFLVETIRSPCVQYAEIPDLRHEA